MVDPAEVGAIDAVTCGAALDVVALHARIKAFDTAKTSKVNDLNLAILGERGACRIWANLRHQGKLLSTSAKGSHRM